MSEGVMVVAGGTGLVGAAAIDAALARGWRVVALVRAGRKIPAREGLETIECDFDALEKQREKIAAMAPTAFLCALGTTIKVAGSQPAFARVDLDYVEAFAKLGIAAGAARFALVSAVGANANSGNFYLRIKGQAEAAVQAAGYARVEIAWPSFLTGERTQARPGEGFATAAASALAPVLIGGLSIYRPIAGATVARALVVGLERTEPGVFVRHYRDLLALAAA